MRWLTWSIAEGTITVWDVATGVALRTISVLESAEEQFDAAALSADGTRVVTSNSNVNAPGLPHEWIKVWDVDSGEELKRFQKSRAWSGAQGMALSADGRYVARPLGPVYIAHLTTGESKVGLELYSMYDYVDAGSGHLLFSPDGRWVLAINGFQLLLWEAGTGRMVATPYLPFMNDASDPTSIIQPTAIAFNANSRTFAVGGDNGSLWIWNTRGEVVTRLAGHIAAVRALAFSPDSQFLASGGRDNTLIIWSVAAGEIVRQTASQ
jgi:WD40 repeat protein